VGWIGDRLAAKGWPLKPRTIQNALKALQDEGLADSTSVEGGNAYAWARVRDPGGEGESCP
jgi:DNA-binding PadR family transcriptional regulator